jgi:hypothetical protein
LEGSNRVVRWILDSKLAVSPLLGVEDTSVLRSFSTVLSFSTPSEYYFKASLPPQTIASLVEKFVWLPTGEYNAPPMPKLVRSILDAGAPLPVLVMCGRGCGRSSMGAIAWLIVHEDYKFPEAVSLTTLRSSCSIDTLPQESVLQSIHLAKRAGLLGDVARRDVDDPLPEYVLLLVYKLYWLRESSDVVREAIQAYRDQGHPFNKLARLLARTMGYSLAGIRVYGSERTLVRVEFTFWIPRGAHPAAVRSTLQPPEGLIDEAASLIQEYAGGDGKRVEVGFIVRQPDDPPWLA